MTLKNKISFLISLLFSVLFGVAAFIIYTLFSNFRADEFENHLKEKAITSIKLLVEVKEIDRQMLKLIDQNSINKLYDEKTLIFDANFNLIYSSLDDTKIIWNVDDLRYLKSNKTFLKKENKYEIYGVFYKAKGKDYYAIVSASDNHGQRKLEYLIYLLLITFVAFTAICWFVTSFAIKKLLKPLDVFHTKIKSINENNLDTRIEVKNQKNEIDLLASEFNLMLYRIDQSYQKQKEFTAHASHELRTPVSRVMSQLENKIISSETDAESIGFFKKLLEDVNQISELISSLLILSKLDNKQNEDDNICRADELIYESIEKLHKHYPEFTVILDIEYSDEMDKIMEIRGSKSLLEIAIINLLKNACIYSDHNQAKVYIASIDKNLELTISNNGATLNPEEQQNLFELFMRGGNSQGKSGLGLGLRIVQRILHQHKATISYSAPTANTNIFKIIFWH
jgi:two-component system, OmpR family, sensor histidine kinase ArlS